MIGAGIVIWFSSMVAGQGVAGEVLVVLAQFRTENRLTLFLELL
jgi:hypothetical protein